MNFATFCLRSNSNPRFESDAQKQRAAQAFRWAAGHAPRIDPAKKIQRGEQLGIFVLFAGCKPGANGLCRSELDYTVYKPDGTVYASKPNLEVWSSEPPPRSNIQLSKAILAIRF